LLKGDDQALTFDIQGSIVSRNISRSTSDVGDLRHRKLIPNMSGKVMDLSLEDSASDIILEPFDFYFQGSTGSRNISQSTSGVGDTRETIGFSKISEKARDSPLKDSDVLLEHLEETSSGRWSKIFKATSFGLPSIPSDLSVDLGAQNDSVYDPSPTTFEANDEYHTLHDLARLAFEKSYSMEKRKPNLSNIPLPESAATFYYGCSPEMEIVESCESINWLNAYLKARRDDINAGVPGKFLHAVMGQDISGKPVLSTLIFPCYDTFLMPNSLASSFFA
jgi:exopolyphosphatase